MVKTNPPIRKVPFRMPMLLSALVCPGMGQLAQRRWWAGIFFLLAFAVAFAVFMWVAVDLIVGFYRMGFEFETYEPDIHPERLLPSFAVALGIYLANLVDVAAAHFRRCRNGSPGAGR